MFQHKIKSVSPLIATILLIVIAVILVVAVLTWGKDFVGTSLSETTLFSSESTSLTGLITSQGSFGNYITIANNSKEDITIVGYRIPVSIEHPHFYLLDDLIIGIDPTFISSRSSSSIYINCIPSNNFSLDLLLEDNSYVRVNINVRESLDNLCSLYDDLIVFTDFSGGVFKNRIVDLPEWNIINNDFDFTTWDVESVVTVDSENTFTSEQFTNRGIYKSNVLVQGGNYNIYTEFTTSSSGGVTVGATGTGANAYGEIESGIWKNFVASLPGPGLMIGNANPGTTTITSLIFKKIQTNKLTPSNVNLVKTNNLYSAEFNGTNSFIEVDCTNPKIWQNGFTLVSWINPNNDDRDRIFDKSTSTTTANGFGVYILLNTIRLRINGEGISSTNSISNLFNNWHFVVITVDNNSKINFYIGNLTNTPSLNGTSNQTSGSIENITTTRPLTIGNRSKATDRALDGTIKLAKAYSRVLTEEEITRIYKNTKWMVEDE